MNNKLVSYIGFAIKSGKVVIGQDRIKVSKNKLQVILLCKSGSDNLKNLALNVANKKKCDVLLLNDSLKDLTKKDIKILAILDENLAKAIMELKEEYISLRGENFGEYK